MKQQSLYLKSPVLRFRHQGVKSSGDLMVSSLNQSNHRVMFGGRR